MKSWRAEFLRQILENKMLGRGPEQIPGEISRNIHEKRVQVSLENLLDEVIKNPCKIPGEFYGKSLRDCLEISGTISEGILVSTGSEIPV